MLEFDVKTNECKKMPPLPRPLTGMATIQWRDQVVVLGGLDKDDEVLNDFLKLLTVISNFEAQKGQWKHIVFVLHNSSFFIVTQ